MVQKLSWKRRKRIGSPEGETAAILAVMRCRCQLAVQGTKEAAAAAVAGAEHSSVCEEAAAGKLDANKQDKAAPLGCTDCDCTDLAVKLDCTLVDRLVSVDKAFDAAGNAAAAADDDNGDNWKRQVDRLDFHCQHHCH